MLRQQTKKSPATPKPAPYSSSIQLKHSKQTRSSINGRKLLHKSTSQSFSTASTPQSLSTPTPQPITAMLLHLSDSSHADFRNRRQTDYEIQAPLMSMRLFPLGLDYTQAPVYLSVSTDDTVGKLAGEIQNAFPIRPAFVSFSTKDKDYARYYFIHELPHSVYSTHFGQQTRLRSEDLKNAVQAEKSNANSSGLPPLSIPLNKLKFPTLPPPFFNNPQRTKIDIIPTKAPQVIAELKERHKATKTFGTENLKEFFGITRKTEKKALGGQNLVENLPTFYDTAMINMPLHPHTPLYDIIQAADLQCHVSYSDEQINSSPALQQFIQANEGKFIEMFPTLSQKDPNYNFRTMKFALTPPKHMLERNYENDGPVSTRALLSIMGVYAVTKLGIDMYDDMQAEELTAQHQALQESLGYIPTTGMEDVFTKFEEIFTPKRKPASAIATGIESHPLAEISKLQAQKQTIIGQMKLYDIELAVKTPITDKISAWVEGRIDMGDLLNNRTPAPPSLSTEDVQTDTVHTLDNENVDNQSVQVPTTQVGENGQNSPVDTPTPSDDQSTQ